MIHFKPQHVFMAHKYTELDSLCLILPCTSWDFKTYRNSTSKMAQ